jgi:hypothetical protein
MLRTNSYFFHSKQVPVYFISNSNNKSQQQKKIIFLINCQNKTEIPFFLNEAKNNPREKKKGGDVIVTYREQCRRRHDYKP